MNVNLGACYIDVDPCCSYRIETCLREHVKSGIKIGMDSGWVNCQWPKSRV